MIQDPVLIGTQDYVYALLQFHFLVLYNLDYNFKLALVPWGDRYMYLLKSP